MKSCVALLLVGLLAITYVEGASRVVGGADAPEGKFPYMAMINDASGYMCGGSIIHKKFILTAAHCVYQSFPRALEVVVGSNKLSGEGGDYYYVKTIHVHKDHQRMSEEYSKNDVALLELAKEINFTEKVKPVMLPDSNLDWKENVTVVLTGFGRKEYNGKFAEHLQFVENEILSRTTCGLTWLGSMVALDYTQICTKTPRGIGACSGDSGSPLVLDDNLQIGVVSFGKPCVRGYPDVYSNVSLFVEWINEIISKA